MKKIAFLEYVFMFDPSKTWSHLSEFEATLAKFFSGMNMEVEIMLPIGEKQDRRILYIRNKEEIIRTKEVEKKKVKSSKK